MNAAAIILMQMNRYIRVFRQIGATHPAAAIVPAEHNVRRSFAFRKLVRRGVFIPVTNERFYLDEAAEIIYRKRRRSVAFVVLTLIAIGLIISYLVAR